MQMTSRRKRPVIRPSATRDARLVVIATEGEITEKIYFNSFGNSRIKILTVPSQDGKSSPEHVCSNLAKFQAEFQLVDDDELWMVVDRDRWPKANMHKVVAICADAKFKIAVSNPCFEIWLAYHFGAKLPNPMNSRALARHLRENGMPFKKNSYDASSILESATNAVARAAADDKDPMSPWPEPWGTRIYLLMKTILAYHPELTSP